jgi:diguanylate cyclase (GGDEF)-like protein
VWAGRLRRLLRGSDTVARLGGDEFGILLAGVDVSEARSVATNLLDMIRGHRSTMGSQALRITASIGMTLLDRPELTPEQLFLEA